MTDKYSPQRRELLAFESNALPATDLIVRPHLPVAVDQGRLLALSVPESVRALGEPLEPFFEACGGRQSISLAVHRHDSQAGPETYVFDQPFVVVGRYRESDLVLVDEKVNFRHFYLQLVGARWMFLDLEMIGRNVNKWVNRNSWGWFECSQELRAGPYTITRVGSPHQETSRKDQGSDPDGGMDLPVVDLDLITGRREGRPDRSWRIAAPVSLVGGSRQCDLCLRDDSVSRVHASLVLTPRGLWVVDLLGRGSVLVNGRSAYWKQIHDGSRLQIGRYRFRVRFEDGGETTDPSRDEQAIRRVPSRQAASGGSLSETAVMALIGHMVELQKQSFEQSQKQLQLMADMQNQFFEHSQTQTQFLAEVLAQMGKSQQALVQQDVARIEEITRELDEIKAELARHPAPRPIILPQKEAVATGEDTLPPDRTTSGAADQPGEFQAASSEATDAHTRLNERMVRLAAERSAGWRRIFAAFTQKPPNVK